MTYDPTSPVETEQLILTSLKYGVRRAYDLETISRMDPRSLQQLVRRDGERLVIQLDRKVWATQLLQERQDVPFETDVTVHTPGPRVWYAPWRRRPDRVHVIHYGGRVTVEARYFAAYPNAQVPHDEMLGNSVPVVQLGQAGRL